MHRHRAAPAKSAVDDRMTDIACGDIEGSEVSLELRRIVDHCSQVAEWNELTVVQDATDEAGVVVPPLFPVRQHLDPGPELGVDA